MMSNLRSNLGSLWTSLVVVVIPQILLYLLFLFSSSSFNSSDLPHC
jgi:hypothetical protein